MRERRKKKLRERLMESFSSLPHCINEWPPDELRDCKLENLMDIKIQ